MAYTFREYLQEKEKPAVFNRWGETPYFFPSKISINGYGLAPAYYRFRVDDILATVVNIFEKIEQLINIGEVHLPLASQCASCEWKDIEYDVSCKVSGLILAEIGTVGRGRVLVHGTTSRICPLFLHSNKHSASVTKGYKWQINIPIGSLSQNIWEMIESTVGQTMGIHPEGEYVFTDHNHPEKSIYVTCNSNGDGTIATSFSNIPSLLRMIKGLKEVEIVRDFPLWLVAVNEHWKGFLDQQIDTLKKRA